MQCGARMADIVGIDSGVQEYPIVDKTASFNRYKGSFLYNCKASVEHDASKSQNTRWGWGWPT